MDAHPLFCKGPAQRPNVCCGAPCAFCVVKAHKLVLYVKAQARVHEQKGVYLNVGLTGV